MSGLVDKITKAVMGISAIVVFVITFLQVLCRFVLIVSCPTSTPGTSVILFKAPAGSVPTV